jgi:hypothetical protein
MDSLVKHGPDTTQYVLEPDYIYIYIYRERENDYPTAGYKIIYSVATLSYDNCYANL